MAVIRCKMCGGILKVSSETVATCEYCGSRQTLPKPGDERRANLYERAGHYWRNHEFDKATGIYEQLLNEDDSDAEVYWSLVLCRYGIEYVEDPATHKRVPTVNRTQFTSIYDDANFKSALQYADAPRRQIYEAEAKAINEIQKEILAISQKEEPFDVFVCYKETDENGRRTPDSVLANELYHQLTQEGFKVFFSRITLEGKLGTAYEPYIFAALNSSKVMVVLGTRPEHFNAVWVKNEWSRYLALIKNGADKVLIPAYRDMDPYDLPKEFSHLQAQDMRKLAFMQDLIRGIKELTEDSKAAAAKETVVFSAGSDAAALLKRAFMCLEDGEWDRADEFCEQVLNIDPECAQAYLGKLMAQLRVHKYDELKACTEPFAESNHYRKAVRFADDKLREELSAFSDRTSERRKAKEAARRKFRNILLILTAVSCVAVALVMVLSKVVIPKKQYHDAIALMEAGKYEEAIAAFETMQEYENSTDMITECQYLLAVETMEAGSYEEAIKAFERLKGYRDSAAKIVACNTAILDRKYGEAIRLMETGSYEEAITTFETLNGYKDSADQIALARLGIQYNDAFAQKNNGNVLGALRLFTEIKEYRDSREQANELRKLYQRKLQVSIAAGNGTSEDGEYTLGLKRDGSVVSAGFQGFGTAGTADWKNIVAISTGCNYTVGLKADGTVVKIGYEGTGQLFYGNEGELSSEQRKDVDLSTWRDIVAISAGKGYGDTCYTVGLKNDGTVVAGGCNLRGQCEVSGWRDIIAVSAGGHHTIGLKADGTVLAAGRYGDNYCNVFDWTDIIAVSAGLYHTVGLKADGTVVAVGENDLYGHCDVSGWRDIVAVSAGKYHTIGLKADGTVVAVGDNRFGQCDVSGWTDIVGISTSEDHTLGLKADGTVVAVGDNDYGECNVSGWTDIKLPG